MKLLLTLLCSIFSFFCLAQKNSHQKQQINDIKHPTDTVVYDFTKVKKMAEYKGGIKWFYKDIKSNLKYPKEAEAAGIKGRVFLSFIIEIDGRITNIEVKRKLGHGCDEAAVAAVRGLVFEKPAYQDEKAVRVRLNIPVGFGI